MAEIGEIKYGREIGRLNSSAECKFVWQSCSMCGKERWVQFVKGEPLFSRCQLCAASLRGTQSCNWRGGRWIDKEGYVRICLQPDDLYYVMQGQCGSVSEHRYVMSQQLGRPLTEDEVVHHKNGIRNDNRPENLKLQTHKGHGLELYLEVVKLREEVSILQQRVTLLEAEQVLITGARYERTHYS